MGPELETLDDGMQQSADDPKSGKSLRFKPIGLTKLSVIVDCEIKFRTIETEQTNKRRYAQMSYTDYQLF